MVDEFQASSSGRGRQIVLVVLLLLVGGAFAYDSLIAKPRVNEAWQKIQALEQDGKSRTNKEVQEMLGGLTPTHTTEPQDNTVVEQYVWRGGLLFNTHKIFVVYTKAAGNDSLYYYSASRGSEPDASNFPLPPKAINIITDPPELQAGGG